VNIFKKKNLVGLDIGSSSIKVVELTQKKRGGRLVFNLNGIGYEPLPPQTIVEGSIMDFTTLSETINKAFDNAHIKNNSVAISLSGTAVMTRKMTLQKMDEAELEESIEFEAKGQFSTPIENIFYDYDIVSEDEDRMDVVLVAIKKEKVSEYISAVLQSGKNVEIVDIDHFALLNSVEYNYSNPPDSAFAIINIGSSMTNVVIAKNGVPMLTRDIAFGGTNFTDIIQKEFHFDFEKAEMIKKGRAVAGVEPSVIDPSLKMLFVDLKGEIDKTFDYYQATSGDEKITKCFLSGGSVKIRNLSSFLETELSVPIEIINPFQNVFYNEKKFDSEYLNEMENVFGVAVGLAMRKLGE